MMFVVLTTYDEHIATVKTGNECELSAYMLLLGKCAIAVCCAEVLFQPSSLYMSLASLHAEWSTEHTTEPDIAQTERVLTRHVGSTPHLWIAVCIRSASVKQKSVSPQ